jgi:hypothetical protein
MDIQHVFKNGTYDEIMNEVINHNHCDIRTLELACTYDKPRILKEVMDILKPTKSNTFFSLITSCVSVLTVEVILEYFDYCFPFKGSRYLGYLKSVEIMTYLLTNLHIDNIDISFNKNSILKTFVKANNVEMVKCILIHSDVSPHCVSESPVVMAYNLDHMEIFKMFVLCKRFDIFKLKEEVSEPGDFFIIMKEVELVRNEYCEFQSEIRKRMIDIIEKNKNRSSSVNDYFRLIKNEVELSNYMLDTDETILISVKSLISKVLELTS